MHQICSQSDAANEPAQNILGQRYPFGAAPAQIDSEISAVIAKHGLA